MDPFVYVVFWGQLLTFAQSLSGLVVRVRRQNLAAVLASWGWVVVVAWLIFPKGPSKACGIHPCLKGDPISLLGGLCKCTVRILGPFRLELYPRVVASGLSSP